MHFLQSLIKKTYNKLYKSVIFNKTMNNKKGIGHIEMLLSFLIFVGFVIFALYFFNPFNPDRLVKTALDYGFREIIKNTTIEIESYEVAISDMDGINGIRKLKINDIDVHDKKVIAENVLGNNVPAERNGNSPNIDFNTDEVHLPSDPNKGFVIFRFNEDFVQISPGGGGGQIPEEKYSIVSYEKIKLISEKRVIALKNYYADNYNKLREEFNLPSRANFEFVLKFDKEEGEEEADEIPAVPKYRPQGVEIFSDMKRFEVLREDGTTKFAELTVRVW